MYTMNTYQQCYNCGRFGHLARFCPANFSYYNQKKKTSRPYSSSTNIECYHCQKIGHIAKKCPKASLQTQSKKQPVATKQLLLLRKPRSNQIRHGTLLEDLPNELLLSIFNYVGTVDTFCGFYDLNTRFSQLALLYSQQCHLDFRSTWTDNFKVFSRKYLPRMNNEVVAVSLRYTTLLNNQGNFYLRFNQNLKKFTNLRSLSLIHVPSSAMDLPISILHEFEHLTHLTLIQCQLSDRYQHSSDLSNIIWDLEKLTHYHFEDKQQLFYIPTITSSSIESVTILASKFRLEQVSRLTSRTPKLRHLCIDHQDLDDNLSVLSPIASITSFKLCGVRSRSVLSNLLRNMPNLIHLTIQTLFININATFWENLIGTYIPNLKTFHLKMNIQFSGSSDTENNYKNFFDTFRNPFWCKRHQWFVRCHRKQLKTHSDILLYTLPSRCIEGTTYLMTEPYESTEPI